jgi:hypothetical protein
MRAKEFITEHTGKAHPDHNSVHQGYNKVRDPGGYYPSYHQMRTGIVLGMMDGTGKMPEPKPPHESWMGPYWTQHPWTEVEHKMFRDARKVIPTEHHQIQPWSKSKEPGDTHKVSPVAAKKKNRFGI